MATSVPPSRAARIARSIQRAAIRQHLHTPAGRRHLSEVARELDLFGALTLIDEVGGAPDEDRRRILTALAGRPERALRQAALQALQ